MDIEVQIKDSIEIKEGESRYVGRMIHTQISNSLTYEHSAVVMQEDGTFAVFPLRVLQKAPPEEERQKLIYKEQWMALRDKVEYINKDPDLTQKLKCYKKEAFDKLDISKVRLSINLMGAAVERYNHQRKKVRRDASS